MYIDLWNFLELKAAAKNISPLDNRWQRKLCFADVPPDERAASFLRPWYLINPQHLVMITLLQFSFYDISNLDKSESNLMTGIKNNHENFRIIFFLMVVLFAYVGQQASCCSLTQNK